MNNRILLSLLLGAMPLTMMAQDDDMYFVPSKQTHERAASYREAPRSTYYCGSNRSVDEYNRRGSFGGSHYEVLSTDTTGNDIIQFSGERGVYPDSTMKEDFALTRQMARYDGYDADIAYREGYRDGANDSWHSTWFFSSYYPWYDSYWYWNAPWYYRRYGWYSTWYDPWYDPWYRPYGYYSYYRPYYYGGSVRSRVYARNGNTGTINRSGRSHGYFTGGSRASSASTARATQRATYNNGVVRSSSGNFSRSTTSSSGNFNRSTTNSSTYNRSSSSSMGSFSRSSGGGSFGGSAGGGGSRGGGSIGRAGRR